MGRTNHEILKTHKICMDREEHGFLKELKELK
jgi:hypothetical protein